VEEIEAKSQFQEEDEEIRRGMLCGRWVLDWRMLVEWTTVTEAVGSKCRYVLSVYARYCGRI